MIRILEIETTEERICRWAEWANARHQTLTEFVNSIMDEAIVAADLYKDEDFTRDQLLESMKQKDLRFVSEYLGPDQKEDQNGRDV